MLSNITPSIEALSLQLPTRVQQPWCPHAMEPTLPRLARALHGSSRGARRADWLPPASFPSSASSRSGYRYLFPVLGWAVGLPLRVYIVCFMQHDGERFGLNPVHSEHHSTMKSMSVLRRVIVQMASTISVLCYNISYESCGVGRRFCSPRIAFTLVRPR